MELLYLDDGWQLFVFGHEGKKRRVTEFHIPQGLSVDEAMTFIADMFHELATPESGRVTLVRE